MKNMRRAMVWLLTLCLMLPMISPVLATGETAATPVVYDFSSVTQIHATSLSDTSNSVLDGLYASGDLNWKYIGRYNQTATMIGGGSRAWDGIRYANKNGNGWFAVKIQSPGDGMHTVTVNYQSYKSYGAVSKLYILPGDTTDIAAALANATALGNFDCNTTGDSYVDCAVTMDVGYEFAAGKEYIVVFYGINNRTDQNSTYACVKNLTVTPGAPVVELPDDLDQKVYDFDLGATDLKVGGASFATKNLSHANVNAAVDQYYRKGELDWKFVGGPTGANLMLGFGDPSEQSSYLWNGLRMYAKDKHDYYVAMKIQSPGTGEYQVTVDYMVHKYGAKKGSIYVLPGDTTDIAGALAKAQAIGSLNYDNGAASGTSAAEPGRDTLDNFVKMEAGQEYLLVFQAEKIGRSNSYMYISKLTMTKKGLQTPADILPDRAPEPEEVPDGSVEYDVDLSDPATGIYSGKQLVASKLEELKTAYEKGTRNWMVRDIGMVNSDSFCFVSAGLTVYGNEGDYYSLKIKSPGQGVHTLYVEYAISGNGGIGAFYILPADTEDIQKAVDPTNMVGKIDFANSSGDPNFTDGMRINVGTWEFGDAEEYILVVESYQHSLYHATRSYTYISKLSFAKGAYEKTQTAERVITPVTVDPGAIKLCEGTLYGTTAQVNGHDYLFQPIEGKTLLIFDLDDGVMVKQKKIPFTVTRGMTVDKDGMVWMVGDSPYIYKYDPLTGADQTFQRFDTAELSPGSYSGFDLVQDEDGCMYFGTYKGGMVLKFDPSTAEYTKLAYPHTDAVYVCGMAVRDGYLYTGLYGDNNGDGKFTSEAVKIDTTTGEIVGRLDLADQMPKDMVMFRGGGLCGDVFFLGGDSTQMGMIAIDINTMEKISVGDIDGTINFCISEEVDGKVWFVVMGKGLCEYDSKTKLVTQVPNTDMVTVGLRCGVRSFIEIDDPVYPGKSLVTYSSVNGIPRIYNIETGNIRTWDDLVDDDYGNPTTLRSVINGVSGSNLIYIGAYNTENCSVYDVSEGKINHLFETNGQTDSLLMYDGVLYAGTYNKAALVRVNLDNPDRNVVLLSLKGGDTEQSRIHTLAAGDGKVFFGSTPDRYEYGGCIGWVDVNTLEKHVERDVVEGLSINCIVYRDGFLYGTGSTDPGTGAIVKEDAEAKLFIYDVENKKKVFECDIADYISGLTTPVPFITGIAADPNVEGKFWGMVSETLFTFTYDTETGAFSVKEELSFDKKTYTTDANRAWFPRNFIFDEEGYLYVAFENKGGFRKINTSNVKDNERIMPVTPMRYVLGEDGNIYYLQVSALMMYPLNVTEADWQKAEAVDTAISLIGTGKITLEHTKVIAEARKAYDALPWKNKALVQKLEMLELAEVDLLEAQIDAIGAIDLSSRDHLYSLQAQYDDMTANMQRFVKNYNKLTEAMKAYNTIINKNAAAEVEKQLESIKGMGEITLEDEDAIRELRKVYDALSTDQKLLVKNAQLLFDAEAKIKVLRQVFIDRLKEIISGLTDTVTLANEPAITEGMQIYEMLHMDERQQVDYQKLLDANSRLTRLQKEAASKVDELILAIGDTIDRSSKDAIEAARNAFNALTPGSQKYVTKLAVLEEAEEIYAGIFPVWAIILIAVGGVLVLAGGAVAVILVLKKKKAAAPVAEEAAEEEVPADPEA